MPVIKVEGGVWERYDALVCKITEKAIMLLGGPRHLILHRNLTWLPSLVEAAYVWLLYDMAGKTQKEIASLLGLTTTTVSKILSAKVEEVKKKIMDGEDIDTHVAGGLARWAYEELKKEGLLNGKQVP